VRTVPLSPPKCGSNSKFVIFMNKNQFKWNKILLQSLLAYKLSAAKL